MSQPQEPADSNSVFPLGRYCGYFSPQDLAFNANLQKFSLRSSQMVDCHQRGQLTTDEVLNEIDQLWTQLSSSKQGLEIGKR